VLRAHITQLFTDGTAAVRRIALTVDGQRRTLTAGQALAPTGLVLLAAGTIQSTRLSLISIPAPAMGANLMAQLRSMITVMFQLPVSYQGTARENIAVGDLDAQPDLSRIEAAARDAGAHDMIAALPKGYDTLLGKWFAEGTELSAGEWQRVAMARAYFRRSQIIVLDEPTSFMDSWAEAQWFARFRRLARGRTGIIITHRLTIAMRADVIHVMQHGQVVESGNHHELLAQGGLYAQSWAAQVDSASDASDMAVHPL